MINSVSLTGRITKDIELKYTQSGIAVGSFTLAVDRQFRSENGDRETDFINCVIWRKSAENLSKYTHKGSLIGVSGHLQVRNYENKQGQRVYVTEVVIDNFALLENKKSSESSVQNESNVTGGGFGGKQSSANDGQPIDVSDDDLPF